MLWVPEADRFAADGDTSFGQEVFDISVAEIKAIAEPDGVADDISWKSVSFISIHGPILAIWAS